MTQKIALVTGASRGLGAALAEALTAEAWHVVAVARTVGALEELDDRVKASGAAGALTLAPMDINDEGAMRHLCRSIYDRWGGASLWAHTAIHAAPLTPAGSIDMKDLDKSIQTNTRATAFLITMTEPLLRAHNGAALFFEDPVCAQNFAGAYGATKAAQMTLARNWQGESAKIGPRVVIAQPAPMPTALRARFYPGEVRAALANPRDQAVRIIAAAHL